MRFENANEEANYETFRECLSVSVIQKLAAPKRPERRRATKGRKNGTKPIEQPMEENVVDDAEELADFIDV